MTCMKGHLRDGDKEGRRLVVRDLRWKPLPHASDVRICAPHSLDAYFISPAFKAHPFVSLWVEPHTASPILAWERTSPSAAPRDPIGDSPSPTSQHVESYLAACLQTSSPRRGPRPKATMCSHDDGWRLIGLGDRRARPILGKKQSAAPQWRAACK